MVAKALSPRTATGISAMPRQTLGGAGLLTWQ